MNYFKKIIEEEATKKYYKDLHDFVEHEYKEHIVFPDRKRIFYAMQKTPYENVKVVIIGQDPYHGMGEACGMCFAVNKGIKIPPSLKNIYKELNRDLGCYIPNHGYLEKWANQGVLLLNSVLTVRKDMPASHQNKGWEIFTDRIINEINKKETPVVFMLWGSFAKSKKKMIDTKKHLVLETSHPSPFSVKNGFEGCSHFSKANDFLRKHNMDIIDWQIENI